MRYKTITSYPNYEVSDSGHIRNKHTGRVLQPQVITKGYHSVRLYHQGNGKSLKVHRLVALAFVDGYFDGAQVNHIDCDKTNNHYSNLEWCTGQANHDHKMSNGLNVAPRKWSELTYDKVLKLHSEGKSTRAIATLTGVSKSQVHKIFTDSI